MLSCEFVSSLKARALNSKRSFRTSAADVTYNTASFPCLLKTLQRLFDPPTPSGKQPLLLLAYKQRHPSERTLWTMLSDQAGIEMIKFAEIPGHEQELDVDVEVGRDEEAGEAVRSGMGSTELWVGRRRT